MRTGWLWCCGQTFPMYLPWPHALWKVKAGGGSNRDVLSLCSGPSSLCFQAVLVVLLFLLVLSLEITFPLPASFLRLDLVLVSDLFLWLWHCPTWHDLDGVTLVFVYSRPPLSALSSSSSMPAPHPPKFSLRWFLLGYVPGHMYLSNSLPRRSQKEG